MKWKKQLCAAAAVLLALGIALAGILLNQHFLVLSGGISRTEIQSPLGDLVRSHLQLVALAYNMKRAWRLTAAQERCA